MAIFGPIWAHEGSENALICQDLNSKSCTNFFFIVTGPLVEQTSKKTMKKQKKPNALNNVARNPPKRQNYQKSLMVGLNHDKISWFRPRNKKTNVAGSRQAISAQRLQIGRFALCRIRKKPQPVLNTKINSFFQCQQAWQGRKKIEFKFRGPKQSFLVRAPNDQYLTLRGPPAPPGGQGGLSPPLWNSEFIGLPSKTNSFG